jgi:hypothetical protein
MTSRTLVFEDFADKLGQVFAIDSPGVPGIPMSLIEAEPLTNRLRPGMRPPFSLVFLAKDPRVLPQSIYRMEHTELGVLEIFLVPIGKDAEGVSYQATFN